MTSTNAYMLMYKLCQETSHLELDEIPEDIMQEVMVVEEKVQEA